MDLSHVILHGDLPSLRQVLMVTDQINYLDEYGYTPITQAVITGDVEKVKLLLEHNADPNQKDLTGRTALHWAVSNDAEELVEQLLAHAADPNQYNISSEPILAKAIMRQHDGNKKRLQQAGANNQFAQDYLRAKLLGHRYELIGSVDIVDPNGVFTEVDYEGFYFESSIDLIRYSLREFQHNFASRALDSWYPIIDTLVYALEQGRHLLQYDHYLANHNDQFQATHRFLEQSDFIMPISQQGHAFSLVKTGRLIAIVDRASDSPPANEITIYYMNRPSQLTADFVYDIAFEKHPIQYIHQQIKQVLALQPVTSIPMNDQAIGNCSWANIEATIPTMKFMLQYRSDGTHSNAAEVMTDSLELFHRWREWDRQRALDFVIQDFKPASPARKASLAAMLAAIVFQCCDAHNEDHFALAKRLLPLIKTRGYEYILDSYKQWYVNERPTNAGKNLIALLQRFDQEMS